jgi:hypothetical protein
VGNMHRGLCMLVRILVDQTMLPNPTSDFSFIWGSAIFSCSQNSGGMETLDRLVAFSAGSVIEREFISKIEN